MAPTPSESEQIASTSISKNETSAFGTIYGSLASDWGGHQRSRDQCCLHAAVKRRPAVAKRSWRTLWIRQWRYSLFLTMPQLRKVPKKNYIFMFFVVICAEKIWKLLRLFCITIAPGYVPCDGDISSGWGSWTFPSLKHTNHCPLGNRRFELPAPCYLAVIRSSMRLSFSAVPN